MKTPTPQQGTRTLTALVLLLALSGLSPATAQLFNGVNYQAVVRDLQGEPLLNTNVALTFNVRSGSTAGPIVFQDSHSTTTNDRGLVSVVIGKGSTTLGSIAALDYANNDYFLQVYVNGAGLPAQRLEAVPMAYKATNMALSDLTDVGSGTPSAGQVLQWNGSQWTPATAAGGGGLWTGVGNDIHYTAGNVGIGIGTPQQRLHVHENTTTPAVIELSNSTTGSTGSDGFQLRVESDGEVQLRQREVDPLTLWTSDQPRLNVLANGRVGINTTSMIGAADLVVRSLNTTGYGGMYLESPSATNGQPFYGYASNGIARAWHYFDEVSDQWRLFNGGDRLAVDNLGRVGMGATTIDASALLHLNSTNKGFLLPRMSTTQRNAINPATEGLMVYDTDMARTMQVQGGTWQALGGSGGGASPWTANTGFGIEYTANRVGIGVNASPFASLGITTGGSTPIGTSISNNYSGGLTTYGMNATVGSGGTGVRYALHGNAFAPSGGTASAYGVYGTAGASSSAANVYGVYGLASATSGGTGYGVYGRANGANNIGVYGYAADPNGYAAWFEGLAMAENELRVSDNIRLKSISANGSPHFEMWTDYGQRTVQILPERVSGGGAGVYLKNSDGSASVTLLSNVNGDRGRVITDELEIKGGADLAEHFAVNVPDDMELLPGMLVSIAPDGSGDLVATTTAYDHRVAGIVSGANGVMPGLTLRQDGAIADGATPVALSGRVFVLADAVNGPIAPGDLLTSGHRAGVAMKVTDHQRALGAVIGKAMTALEEGTGYVLVLVNLQ